MKHGISERVGRLGVSSFDLFAKAEALRARGVEVIHLEVGEPDFPTPQNIVEAAYRAMKEGKTHYVLPQGVPELREAISEYEYRRKGVRVDPAQIAVTPGAKPAILYTLFAIVNPGDEVLYPEPGYMSYPSLIRLADGTAVPYVLREAEGFQPDPDDIARRITPRTVAIILNSPSNPTGAVTEADRLQAIVKLAHRHGLYVISDEIYSRLVYDGPFASVMAHWEDDGPIVFIDGFSKAFAMTGWRLGYGLYPKHLIKAIVKMITNNVSCAPSFAQYAAVEALLGPQDAVEQMIQAFRRRRDLILQAVAESRHLSAFAPGGAFYLFPRFEGVNLTAHDLTMRILEEAHVSVLPGTFFGESGEGHLRISFAAADDDIVEGIRRIDALLDRLAA